MNSYTVKKAVHSFSWSETECGKINVFNWEKFTGYDPQAEFQMIHDDKNIYIRLTAHNDYIVSKCKNINDMVCGDSCMEAFFTIPSKPDTYFNFEFNSAGVMFLGCGKSRSGRTTVDPEIIKKYVTVMAEADKIPQNQRGKWQVTAIINKELFPVLVGEEFTPGKARGSFYKCGDRVIPHFIAWNKIGTDHPDFHTPEYFGDIIFE